MITRRKLMTGVAGTLAAGAMVPGVLRAAGGADGLELGDDGLHKQPWFMDSFLELGDDLQTAADSGRGLMVLW
ncbi:MAG: thioredoxin, partial [Pseudomonadota bacterium]|nr:thioredoxin [Pseudomonadota bacterium]